MELQSIQLKTLNLIKIDLNDQEHLCFLKELFQHGEDSSMDFLGDLSKVQDKNAFIVKNADAELIGYFSMSIPITNQLGLLSTGIYYAIVPKQRNKGYATKLLQEVSSYLLKEVDMLVLSIDKNNMASQRVAEKNNFQVIFEDEEDMILAKYSKSKIRNR